MTESIKLYKNGFSIPSAFPCLTARLKRRLKTYPRPSFDNTAPSLTAKTTVRRWSAITLNDIWPVYWIFVSFSMFFIIVKNVSVSKLVSASWIIQVVLSSPIPVSIFLLGNSGYWFLLKPGFELNWENTIFHISIYLSFSISSRI